MCKQNLPGGSKFSVTGSCFLSGDIFLVYLQRFQNHHSTGKCLRTLDIHYLYSFLRYLESYIATLGLPLHTTDTPQTVFELIKTHCH